MRRRLAATAAGLASLASVAVAAPAHAYDADAYGFAASHQISASDIPSAIGAYKRNPQFSAAPTSGTVPLCEVPTVDASSAATSVRYPGPKLSYSAVYTGKGTQDAPMVIVTIDQYPSARKATHAFTVASRRIVACKGAGTSSFTNPDTGATTTFASSLASGLVPSIEANGVKALFVASDSTSATVPGDSRYVNDSYSVVWLVDDVVMTSTYFANDNDNISDDQRAAVATVAATAATIWQG